MLAYHQTYRLNTQPLARHVEEEPKQPKPSMTLAQYAAIENKRLKGRIDVPQGQKITPHDGSPSLGEQRVYDYIRSNPGADVHQICAALNITRASLNSARMRLKAKGFNMHCKRAGTGGVGRYWVAT